MSVVTFKNNGPLPLTWSIVFPEEGGVTELQGQNGAGKTETLEALNVAMSRSGRLNRNRDSDVASVTIDDAIVMLRQKQTMTGELELAVLPGKFSVDTIVDPDIDDEPRADAARMRAIAGMAAVDMAQVMPMFHELVGSRAAWEEAVPGEVVAKGGDDILAVASAVKRHFESVRRKAAEEADSLLSEAHGIDLSVEGIHDTGITKEEVDAKYQAALQSQAIVQERLRLANSTRDANAAARAEFARLEASGSVSIVEAEAALTAAVRDKESRVADCEAIKARVVELQQLLRDEQAKLVGASDLLEASTKQLSAAKKQLEAARTRAQAMDALRKSMDAQCPDPPSDAELAAVADAVASARSEVEDLGKVEHARRQRLVANEKREKAKAATERKHRFDELASAVEQVVTKFVRSLGIEGLEIRDGRLYSLDNKPFHELSEGERYAIAIPIAAALLRRKNPNRKAYLTISQPGWAALQPSAKRRVHQLGLDLRINIVAAVCTDYPPKPGLAVAHWVEGYEGKPIEPIAT